MRVISYGGGIQSTALVLLAIRGEIDYPTAVWANVGDDSEHPGTLRWIRDVMVPYAEARGYPIVETQRVKRDGQTETLWQRLNRPSRSIDIPVYMAGGAPGNRKCTGDFKISVIRKWLKANGASAESPATVAIGISTDEMYRANSKRTDPIEIATYPLLDMGWSRAKCQAYIFDIMGQIPPKSSCYFCPFHRPQQWAEMRRDEPELFWQSVALERTLNQRRADIGRDSAYLTRLGAPLDVAVGEAQATIPGVDMDIGDDGCDSGACWT